MPIAELMTFLLCFCAIFMIGQTATVVGLWKMFVKAGRPGWTAIIPLYRDTVRNDIAGVSALWTYVEWMLYVGIIVAVYVTNMILEPVLLGWVMRCVCNTFTYGSLLTAYGQRNTAWSMLIVVLFPYIILPQIGFGSAAYVGGRATVVVSHTPDSVAHNSTLSPNDGDNQ